MPNFLYSLMVPQGEESEFVESHGYELVSTTSKDPVGSSEVDDHLDDAEVIISTPFYPAYITKERIDNAPNLKICITAGVGSDHVDLDAANKRKITVAEVTGSNVVSVAEHVVMTILDLGLYTFERNVEPKSSPLE